MSSAVSLYSSNPYMPDQGSPDANEDKKGSAQIDPKAMIEELLRELIKAKTKAKHPGLGNTAATGNDSLQDQLEQNPIFKKLIEGSGEDVSKKDIMNIFFIIFSAMNKNDQASNSALAASATHILSEMNTSAGIANSTQASLNESEQKIQDAYNEAHKKSLLSWLLPLIVAIVTFVVTVAVTVATSGAAAPEIAEAAPEMIEMADMASAAGEGGADVAPTVTSEATEATESATTTASQIKDVASSLWNNLLKPLGKFALKYACAGVACAGLGGYGAYQAHQSYNAYLQKEEQQKSDDATAELQGSVAIASSATGAIQAQIGADQSREQTEESIEQANKQAKSTLISQMSKVFTLGSV